MSLKIFNISLAILMPFLKVVSHPTHKKANLIFLDAIERRQNEIIAQLEALLAEMKQRANKKWRMRIDRNYDTKLIQDVIIEQVEEE